MTMFLVFAGDTYYPKGGWEDYKGKAETMEDALLLIAQINCDWWQIVHGDYIVKKGRRER
jgi:hypothetical protein